MILFFIVRCRPPNLQQRLSQRKSLMRLTQKGSFQSHRGDANLISILFMAREASMDMIRILRESMKRKEYLRKSFSRWWSKRGKSMEQRQRCKHRSTRQNSRGDEVSNMVFALSSAIFQAFALCLTLSELRWVNCLHKKTSCASRTSTTAHSELPRCSLRFYSRKPHNTNLSRLIRD